MIDRIFSGAVTRGAAQQEGKMSYTEFVWFLLAEEDKRAATSIEYWWVICFLKKRMKPVVERLRECHQIDLADLSLIQLCHMTYDKGRIGWVSYNHSQ